MNTKFKERGNIFQNELDKACFQYDLAHGDFKDLPRITAADRVSCDNVFNTVKNPRYDGYQPRLTSMVYTFFYKKTFDVNKGTRINFKSKQLATQQLTTQTNCEKI